MQQDSPCEVVALRKLLKIQKPVAVSLCKIFSWKRNMLATSSHCRSVVAGGLMTALFCCALASQGFPDETRRVESRPQRRAQKAEPSPSGPPPVTPPVRDAEHRFQLRVRDYVELKQRNIVMQRHDYSCGAACLATVCKYYWGDNVDEGLFLRSLDSILTDEEIADRIKNGLAMSDLRRAAVKAGYQATVGKLTFVKLMETRVPVIVGISPGGHDHFVVYRGTDGEWVYVADPIRGNLRMPIPEFTKQWQKNAILAIARPGKKVRDWSPLSVRPEEIELGELNNQLIRTQPQRQAAVPKQTFTP